jgi:uncharacterized protein
MRRNSHARPPLPGTPVGGAPCAGPAGVGRDGYRQRMRQTTLVGPDGVAWAVDVPESWRERMRGLIGARALGPHHAMLLERCRSVHTFGMRFPIDVVFLDRELQVVDVRRVDPGRLTLPRLRARHILECAADARLGPGDRFSSRTQNDANPSWDASEDDPSRS